MPIRLLAVSLAICLLAGCPQQSTVEPDAPQPIAVELIPFLEEAAGMKNAVLDEIAMASAPPHVRDLENHSLTAFLVFGAPVWSPETPAAGFRPLSKEPPTPAEMVKLLEVSRSKGYVSVLQGADVTSVSGVKDDSGVVRGSVKWATSLYEAEANYVARIVDDTWRIEEFEVPGVGTLKLNADGLWRIVAEAGQPAAEEPGK